MQSNVLENPSAKNAGFSLVEVIVASLIFTVTIAGVLSSIAILKPPAEFSEKGIEATYYVQNVLEDLRSKVDARTWSDPSVNSNPLAPGTHTLPTFVSTNGVTYSSSYVVTQDAMGGREVNMTVSW